MEYSALFKNVFEALNLLLIIFLYFCTRNSTFGSSSNTEFWLEFCHCWPLVVPLHHVKNKCFITAACVDINFQLSIPAKSVCMASHVKLPVQNMNFRPSPPPNPGKMPISVDALAFALFVLNYHMQPMYPIVPSPVNIREKSVTATASLIVDLVKLVSGLELLSCEIMANPAADADVLVLNVHKTPS
jgi:hypothetical protein